MMKTYKYRCDTCRMILELEYPAGVAPERVFIHDVGLIGYVHPASIFKRVFEPAAYIGPRAARA